MAVPFEKVVTQDDTPAIGVDQGKVFRLSPGSGSLYYARAAVVGGKNRHKLHQKTILSGLHDIVGVFRLEK